KAAVDYSSWFGLDIGLRLEYRTGTPIWENFANTGQGGTVYRSPRGTGFANNPTTLAPDFNDPTSWVQMRNPSQLLVHPPARYDFGRLLHWKQRLELVMLVVNVFNNSDATALFDQYSATSNRFGTVVTRNGPLQGELILRVRN